MEIWAFTPDLSSYPANPLTAPKSDFRYPLESGLKSDIAPCPKGAKERTSLALQTN
jgi:hypothetical protein